MEKSRFTTKPLKPAQVIVLSFGGVIIMGALLLMLPVSSSDGVWTPFLNALFTSTSAVCVTGLVVVDTGTYWSTFGQVVILMLIQIGGLGFMTMTTSVAILLGKRIGLRNRMVMQEALNQFSISGVIRLTRYVIIATLLIEIAGAFLLSFRFVPEFGWLKGIFYSIFHSVSAFCNAGFDIMGNYKSMTAYSRDPLVSIVIMVLIVLGGLGFAVLADFTRTSQVRKWSLHTKLVLFMTSILILVGFVVVFTIESGNPATMGSYSFSEKIVASFFHAITPRTAGFNTLDIASMRMPTRFMTMVMMFIGGSPGSTAGGIKTTTFGMMILSIVAVFKGSENINFANKRISRDSINKALAVIFISTFWIVIMTFFLIIFESEFKMEEVLFESLSAFGTVGLSMGITPYLNEMGKVIITLMMFFGRLGPLTIVIAISRKSSSKGDLLKYPEGKIIVG